MSDASLSILESIYNELFRLDRQLAEVSRMCEELLTRPRMLSDRITEINPGDYIDDAAEYDGWLQNLAEEDGGGVKKKKTVVVEVHHQRRDQRLRR
uniref:Uncharacterized protein n=1 Tax=Brassica campestris TaxID=3711 RepID=M4EVT9_BRACM